jgi:hypothetical protein
MRQTTSKAMQRGIHIDRCQKGEAMRNVFAIMLSLLLLLPSLPVYAEKQPALEQLILQQHLTQKELERSLTMIREEEKQLQTEIARLDQDLDRQKLIMAAMKRHAGEVARAYYTGERVTLWSLLFDAENFNDFLLLYDFLQLLYQRDMEKLEKYQAERAKAEELQKAKQHRLASLTALRVRFENQLKELLAVQAEKEKNLQQVTDPTTMNALMDHLVVDWQERGLPAFRTFFGVLSKVMFQIPELATPDRISSEDLFSHTLTITQDDFNRFLMSKDELFKQAKFSFDNNQLIVEGTYNQMNLRVVGTYEVVSSKELKFHITELAFDGFQLPHATIDEMEKQFDLSFYPGMISSNLHVEGITLADQALKLRLKVDLPFGFGYGNK